MTLHSAAVRPPIAPMLARLVRDVPRGDYVYEPKWDGFRALVFRDGDSVELQSRHGRPLARYYPELVHAIRALPADGLVLDGEIVIVRDGRFDFETLMLRSHPAASRVATLSAQSPATFIAFDVLAVDGEDLRDVRFDVRRARLRALLEAHPGRVIATPATADRSRAVEWLERRTGNGVDGVVAKDRSLTYQAGKRAMLKVKVERTGDCVVAGFRVMPGGLLASLLLGLYDESGTLRHVGVCASFSRSRRRELFEEMTRAATRLTGHPWEYGFGLEGSPVGRLKGSAGRWDPGMSMDWVPIEPLVAEVAYDTVDDRRFRHPAQFRRWRPDRTPASCTFDQLDESDADLDSFLPDLAPSG